MEPCEDCGEDYSMGELTYGLCADCYDRFDSQDLEDKLEELMS